MIKAIKVVPRIAIANLIENKNAVYNSKLWHLISIHCKSEPELLTFENREILKKLNCIEMLSLCFDDITEKQYLKFHEELKSKNSDALFSEKQAYEIVNFVNKVKDRLGDEILVVHCGAGVSRSGAVGVFINEYLGFSYSGFIKMNPNISPNDYVLGVLKRVSGIAISENNSVFAHIAQ